MEGHTRVAGGGGGGGTRGEGLENLEEKNRNKQGTGMVPHTSRRGGIPPPEEP